jgi:protein ImuB
LRLLIEGVMFASIHFNENQPASSEVLLSCAKSFSPFVEFTDDRTVVFSIDGLNAFYPTPQKIAHAIAEMASRQGHHPNIAIASNADAALLAVRNFTGVTVLTDAARLSALDQLHVESLRLPDEASEMLEDWGIETLKEFSDLPTADLAVRLGKEGLKLQRVARGEMRRPLMVTRSEPLYEKRIDLDFTVDLIEPLLFGLSGPLSEACEMLGSEGRAISDLSARFGLHDRTSYLLALKFPVPIVKSKTLLHLLRMELEARPPGGAVVSIDLRIGGAPPRRTQGGLFLPQSPEPEKLELTLARLRGLVGDDKLGVPFLIDTYRPDAFLLRAASFPAPSKSAQKSEASAQPLRLALRRFRPPLKATVLLHAGRPSGIRASDRQGKVQIASGPWRGSGEWWSKDEWSREEWDVELEEGSVYRIFRDPTDAWFIDGVYD